MLNIDSTYQQKMKKIVINISNASRKLSVNVYKTSFKILINGKDLKWFQDNFLKAFLWNRINETSVKKQLIIANNMADKIFDKNDTTPAKSICETCRNYDLRPKKSVKSVTLVSVIFQTMSQL